MLHKYLLNEWELQTCTLSLKWETPRFNRDRFQYSLILSLWFSQPSQSTLHKKRQMIEVQMRKRALRSECPCLISVHASYGAPRRAWTPEFTTWFQIPQQLWVPLWSNPWTSLPQFYDSEAGNSTLAAEVHMCLRPWKGNVRNFSQDP